MCFPKTPAVPAKPTPPKSDENSALVQEARRRARDARGSSGNIFTSALGDSGFGASVVRGATKLGL